MTGLVAPLPRRWRGVAMVVPFIILMALGWFYTNMVQRETEQKLCRVTGVMMQDAPPPSSERERRAVKAMEEFRADLDC